MKNDIIKPIRSFTALLFVLTILTGVFLGSMPAVQGSGTAASKKDGVTNSNTASEYPMQTENGNFIHNSNETVTETMSAAVKFDASFSGTADAEAVKGSSFNLLEGVSASASGGEALVILFTAVSSDADENVSITENILAVNTSAGTLYNVTYMAYDPSDTEFETIIVQTERTITVTDTPSAPGYSAEILWADKSDPDVVYDNLGLNFDSPVISKTLSLIVTTTATADLYYSPGDLEFRIPGRLWAYRDSSSEYAVYSSISIPMAPESAEVHPFSYTLDADSGDIIITNANGTVGAGYTYTIQLVYSFKPYISADGAKKIITAECSGKANGGSDAVKMTTSALSITNKSSINVKVTKSGSSMYIWNKSPLGIYTPKIFARDGSEITQSPADFDSYNWVIWQIDWNPVGGSPFRNLKIEDTLGNDGGEVYAVASNMFYTNRELLHNSMVWETDADSGMLTIYPYGKTDTGPAVGWNGQGSPKYFAGSAVVYVRYPKLPGNQTSAVYTNSASVTVSSPDHPDTTYQGSAQSQFIWEEFVFSHSGNSGKISKSGSDNMSLLKMLLGFDDEINWSADAAVSAFDSSYVTFSENEITVEGTGGNKPGLRCEIYEDILMWKYDGGVYKGMTKEDFEFTSVGLNLRSVYYSRTDGTSRDLITAGMPDVEVWALYGTNADYVKIASLTPQSVKSQAMTSSQARVTVALPPDTYRIKVVFTAVDTTIMTIHPAMKMKADSPVLAAWINEFEEADKELSKIIIQNFAAVKLYTENETTSALSWLNSRDEGLQEEEDIYGAGIHLQRINALVESSSDLGYSSIVSKTVSSGINDPVNQQIEYTATLVAAQRITKVRSDTLSVIHNAGAGLETIREGVFYDLLPLGMYYKEGSAEVMTHSHSTVANGYGTPAVVTNAEVTEDFRGTGRQLLKVTVRYERTDVENFGFRFKNEGSQFTTGFDLTYKMILIWENIPVCSQSDMTNYFAFQPTEQVSSLDGSLIERNILKGDGYKDDGSYFGALKDDSNNYIFADMRGDGVTDDKDTYASSARIVINVPLSTAAGLIKTVRRINGPESYRFTENALVPAGGQYEYRLYVVTTLGRLRDVILFDKLEQAANRDGGSGETGWQGTFRSVNVNTARQAGINPVVYYYTGADRNPVYFTAEDIASSTVPAGWTTEEPDDKTSVSGIAVDLTKNKSGGAFEFPDGSGTFVTIQMDAPAAVQSEKYAYNHAAYYSTFHPISGLPETATLEVTRTKVELYEPLISEIEVIKTVSGDPYPAGSGVFSFTIAPDPGTPDAPLPSDTTLQITGSGAESFGGITFLEEGEYKYIVAETDSAAENFVYDKAVYTVTVTVTRNTENVLEAEYEYKKSDPQPSGAPVVSYVSDIMFANVYTIPTGDLCVEKTAAGNDADTEKEFSFTVTLGDTDINGTYGDMTFTDGVAVFVLKHGESKTAEGLFEKTAYIVTEADYTADGYTVLSENTVGTITKDETRTVSFVNTRNTYGSLSISKTVSGNAASTTKEFTFTVILADTSINGTYGDMTFTDGAAVFVLKHGEVKTAADLPNGVSYSVTETDYTSEGYITVSDGENGTIEGNAAKTAVFTNTRNTFGSLSVTKAVAGNEASTEKEFSFTVTLGDTGINGTYGDMLFADGTAEFNLRHGETMTAADLPNGTSFTVTEADYTAEGYITRSTGSSGRITGNETMAASFTNTRNTYGSLSVAKILEGNDTDPSEDFVFIITLSDKSISGSFSGIEFTEGSGSFTLKGGETKIIEGLPGNSEYIVEEYDYTMQGYITQSSENTGRISSSSVRAAVFENTRNTYGSLRVMKIVRGNEASTEEAFRFKVILEDTEINGIYGEMTFTDGTAEFTLRHGESVTATDLPNRTAYTVIEEDYSQEGYVTEKSGDAGTVKGNTLNTAVFENIRGTEEDPPLPPDGRQHGDPGIPQTGDSSASVFWLIMAAGSAVLAAEMIIFRRRKSLTDKAGIKLLSDSEIKR